MAPPFFQGQIKLWDTIEMVIGFSAIWYDGMLSLISFSGCAGDINSVQSEVNTLCPRVISIYSYQLSWDNTEKQIQGGRVFSEWSQVF